MPELNHKENNRITILDGFRAIAALGVLWIHTWTVHEQPNLYVYGFDIMKPINIVGNGVDLFFVISGFCMYYFYAKNMNFSYQNFGSFLLKRWQRLSPVFYFSTIIYILLFSNSNWQTDILKFLTSVFYLNSISVYNAEGFMWSLGTEWQFYLVIPFLLIYQHKEGFSKTLISISTILFLVAFFSVIIFKEKSNILTNQIIFRYFEFVWGIIIGRLFLINYKPKFNSNLLVLFFIFVAYAGRTCLTEPILAKGGDYRNIIKLIGFNIMALGFSGIIYTCLTSKNIINKVLNNRLFSFIGKISYSFYLWHGLVHVSIGRYLIHNWGSFSNLQLILINFTLSTLILIPISYLSYRIFEDKTYTFLQKTNR